MTNPKIKGSKKPQKKRGGALLNLDDSANAIANTSDLIQDTGAWRSVLNDDLVRAFNYLPSPFSTQASTGANYMSSIDDTTQGNIMPRVGGAKKSPAKKKASAKKKTQNKK